MGTKVNGARSFLNLLEKACQMSRMRGFRTGLNGILGTETATALLAVWEPACLVVDAIVAVDNFFNQRDTQNDDGAGEDGALG